MIDKSYDIIFEDLFVEIVRSTHPKDVRKTIETNFIELAKNYYIELYEPYVKSSTFKDRRSYKYLAKDKEGVKYAPFNYSIVSNKKYPYDLHRNFYAEEQFQEFIQCIDEEILQKHYILQNEKEDVALYQINPDRKTPLRIDNVEHKLYELSFVIVLNQIGLSEVYDFLEAQLKINFDENAESFYSFLTGLQNVYFPQLAIDDFNKINSILEYFIHQNDKVKNKEDDGASRPSLSDPDILTVLNELNFFSTNETVRIAEIKILMRLIREYHHAEQVTIERYVRSIFANDKKSPYRRKRSKKLEGKIHANLDKDFLKSLLAKEKITGMTREEYISFWNHIEEKLQ